MIFAMKFCYIIYIASSFENCTKIRIKSEKISCAAALFSIYLFHNTDQ